MDKAPQAGEKFAQLIRIMDRLRGEEGCPWDKEQDEKSIANYFLEEVYEAIEAIFKRDGRSLREELGDVLMEIVFLSRIYKEKGEFEIADVIEDINEKMIRRHPHVFGEGTCHDPDEVTAAWNRQKSVEKNSGSLLSGISSVTPALLTAFQIGLRASSCGFDWSEAMDVLQKVKEEISELEKVIQSKKTSEMINEMGDVLFSLANVSRHIGINPEIALRTSNKKFIARFGYLEDKLKEKGLTPSQVTLAELDELWEQAKAEIG
jgi:MazG family protein